MELQQLLYFETVAKLEHMTKAAEKLHITQPALSRAISRLEGDMGTKLFDRIGRQIKLNEYGLILLEHLKRSFKELEEAERKIKDLSQKEKSTVSISTSSTSLMPYILAEFKKSNPDVIVKLTQNSIEEVYDNLIDGKFDFCLTSTFFSDENILLEPILEEEILVLVPNTSKYLNKAFFSLEELKSENLIVMNSEYESRKMIDEFLNYHDMLSNIAFEVNDTLTLGEMISLGLGISFIPQLTWKRLNVLFGKNILAISIKDINYKRTLFIGRLKNRYLSNASKEFYDFTKEQFTALL
ncbi:LysR family transcriptional regulator [Clostridium sp. 19966]|uniref:LysR family transcriptional regulator n=1 Tax=Clostridium sp. 19966 TaxID=2768166 RepID=UPI0028E03A1B|nr:LysR family transcriptional regulator [Clostridium sp. 19966]MDT8715133.1 LysR family transcriptional regulator [Clostridium sp. 19966]